MYAILVTALISTLIYFNLLISDYINAKVNPYAVGKNPEDAVLISKIKYIILVVMAFSWGAVIRFW